MDINEFFRDMRFALDFAFNFDTMQIESTIPSRRTRIVLADGESVSIQANEFSYCSPRQNFTADELATFINPYFSCEIGFPSFKADEWMEYAEQPEIPTDTVYGYVPVGVVQAVLDLHGGIDVDATLKLKHDREVARQTKLIEQLT